MAVPITRDEFKEFCLRALGKPVLQINVDDTQVEDRIDEALYLFQQYHMDAVNKEFVLHKITGSTMLISNATGTFQNSDPITGGTSNASGYAHATINATAITFYGTTGTFEVGETITGGASGVTAVIDSITLGDMDHKYVALDDDLISVTRVFVPWDGRIYGDILFDPNAQFNLSFLQNFTNESLIPYVMGRQYQQLLSDTLRGRPGIRFQRHMNRLYVDVSWYRTFRPDQYLCIEAFRVIDPDTYPNIWSDRWLQRYTIALIKRQWGMNLSKYNGIALPGGVTLDGRTMLVEANQEVKDLEAELESKYQLPIDFIIG